MSIQFFFVWKQFFFLFFLLKCLALEKGHEETCNVIIYISLSSFASLNASFIYNGVNILYKKCQIVS